MATMKGDSGSIFKNTTPTITLNAPHPVLDAAGFPKKFYNDLPLGQQEAFAHFYPNGLPVTYDMDHGKDSGGIPQRYLENHLPTRFYTHPPPSIQAKFSTMHGQQASRKLGELLPERRIHLWNRDEIQSVCNSLRRVFWADMKRMQKPSSWNDLWDYFDPYDLYHYGALNLWNILNTIFDENQIISRGWNADVSLEIGHFADKWIETPENVQKLKEWDGMAGPLVSLLSTSDWKYVGNLEDDELGLLRSALKYRRDLILSGFQSFCSVPTDVLTAHNSGNLVNWLADSPILSSNGLPLPPASEPVHEQSDNPASNAGAPCFVQNGSHYYHPLGQRAPALDQRTAQLPKRASSLAVEALQHSVDAATVKKGPTGVAKKRDVVIAMGSSRPPPAWNHHDTKPTSSTEVAERETGPQKQTTNLSGSVFKSRLEETQPVDLAETGHSEVKSVHHDTMTKARPGGNSVQSGVDADESSRSIVTTTCSTASNESNYQEKAHKEAQTQSRQSACLEAKTSLQTECCHGSADLTTGTAPKSDLDAAKVSEVLPD